MTRSEASTSTVAAWPYLRIGNASHDPHTSRGDQSLHGCRCSAPRVVFVFDLAPALRNARKVPNSEAWKEYGVSGDAMRCLGDRFGETRAG
jgi:hypothetical protein